MKKFILALTALGLALPALPAAADPPPWAPAHGHRHKEYRDGHRHRDRIYDDRGRYYHPRRITRNDHIWRGRDGRYYCRRDNGTTGLIIGAGLGALTGSAVAGRGDKTLGAVVGGVLGGVVGREIDRGDLQCR
ncbi:glycine zipper 2TM domain-containing protein [Novosphingobium colocasiae]|uniref:17 kDa surface antigen n=1 Tax=Novosphingobium colocasiae TaxID=1256513 RepID=A0A918UGT4_9SPHN|nr:glycine zipper 2TM domain-containing protein [Novosphingobium colocasiae]GGZ09788.1 hypothetical protein GCM10011614_25990 [Novosphingobium colocasiae]